MADRSLTAAPHARPRPGPEVVRQIVRLRWRHRLGPVQIAGRLGMPASTVHAVLVRCRINRLCRIDRVTGEPLRRYEHAHPGSLIHVDVTKFGNIPDGGGCALRRPSAGPSTTPVTTARRTGERGKRYQPEHRDRVPAHRHRRPLPRRLRRDLHRREGRHRDRGPAASRRLVRRPRRHRRTRPVRQRQLLPLLRLARRLRRARHHPQAHPPLPPPDQRQDRTLPPHPGRRLGLRPLLRLEPNSATQPCRSWLHFYNHHRAHSAIGGKPPVSRLTNLPGHHT